MIYAYGQTIQAAYVTPDPQRPNHFIAEMQPAVIVGFSNEHQAKRGWGYRGSALVEFADGKRSWSRLY